jgi:hypothetical protein
VIIVKEAMYTPACTLDSNYTFMFEGKDFTTPVSGDLEHAMLYAGSRQFENTYKRLYKIAGKKNIKKTNYLNASIGILHTDAYLEEGDPGELEFTSYPYRLSHRKDKYTFAVNDLYNPETNFSQADVYTTKAGRNTDFNAHLNQHLENARLPDLYDYYDAKTNINTAVEDSQFHEHFHHTEQGLMHSLYRADSMEMIYGLLKQQKNMNSLVAIFVDIHTPRPMCVNCNVGVVGFQDSHEHGFRADFQNHISNEHEGQLDVYLPDDGLGLKVRVSCTQHESRDKKGLHKPLEQSLALVDKPKKTTVTFSYERPRQVVQAYVDTGIHDAIITDNNYYSKFWQEDIFLSHELPDGRYNEFMKNKAPK